MSNPVPVQTYYVPVREDDTVLLGSEQGHVEIGKGSELQDVDTFSLISFGIAAEGTVIYYDNWEDGYELIASEPTQTDTNGDPTTFIWGDNDASNNGIYIEALDKNNDGTVSDDEDYFLGGEAFNITDIVDLQRSDGDFFFDASDKISATFPIAVSRLTAPMENSNDSNPNNDSIRNIATGAVEVQDTSKYGDRYVIPVGGDGSGNTDAPTGAFDLAFAHVMAAQNGTTVYLNGTQIAVLDAGETVVRSVVEGDEITTYDPSGGTEGPGVQVTLITRDDGSQDNEQRWYSLTPTDDWSSDYVTPVGVGDDFNNSSNGGSTVWLYNDGSTAIDVVMQTRNPNTGVIESTTLTVPAGGTVQSPELPDGSGARFTSVNGDDFYAVLQVDSNGGGERNDWGHPLIPVEQLTSQGLITFGFGNTSQLTDGNSGASRSLTFVTPLQDAIINVDYDGDGVVDTQIAAAALESVSISDPTDDNMTGALIFATDSSGNPVDIAIAHGQDPAETAPESQSIDAGVVTIPLPEVFSSKVNTLVDDADNNGVFSPGDTVEFTISTLNFGRIDIGEGGYIVVDDLSSFSDVLDYVPGSTTYNLSDGRGEVSLSDSSSGTPFPLDDGFSTTGLGDGSAASATLNVGETHTITFQAVIKDFEDLPAGTVSFENTGELQTNGGGLINNFSTNSPIVFEAGVAIEKTTNGVDADTGPGENLAIGTPITWRYEVSNTGETFLADVVVSDDQGETPVYVSGDTNQNNLIDPDETWVYEATGTAEDGAYRNIGTVTATPVYRDGSAVADSAGGGTVTDSDASAYFGASTPSIAFDKVIVDVAGQGPNGSVTEAGQFISYILIVSNDGDVDLTGVTVEDPLTGTSENIGALAVGEERRIEVEYEVQQSDLDTNGGGDGDIDNTATADSNETDPVSDSEDVPLALTPALQITKVVDAVDAAGDGVLNAAGDIIEYELVTTNTGNTTLTGVTVVDPLTGLNVAVGTLAPGESHTAETSYAITQSDLDTNGGGDGDIDNTATADSNETGPVSDSEDVPVVLNPELSLDKTVVAVDAAGDGVLNEAGDIIEYEIVTTNTGNITLTGVTVEDPLTGLDIAIGTLAPGESHTAETSYAMTQSDLDTNGGGDGDIDNTATADANETGPSSDSEDVPIVLSPLLRLNKKVVAVDAAGDGVLNAAGDIIEYELVTKNMGNTTLTGVTVVDPLTGVDVAIGTLAPGETHTTQTSYAITQNDLDTNGGGDGDIDNTATADANETGPSSDSEDVPLALNPALLLDKKIVAVDAAGDGVLNAAGDVIEYELVTTNTGNTTLTGVTVVDPLTGLDVAVGTLAPGESHTAETSYAITQNDLDTNGGGDGDIDNTATAASNESDPSSDSEDAPVEQSPELRLNKKVVAVDAAGDGVLNEAGDLIEYKLITKNTGNTTLTGVTVVDPLTGLDIAIGTLAPGEKHVTETTYAITQRDINRNGGGDGDIDNTATADSNETGPDSDHEEVPVEYNPALNIEKIVTAVDAAGDGIANLAGNLIEYEIVVSNTGNTTLFNVSVEDPLTGLSEIIRRLKPGETTTFDTAYALTQHDLDTNGGGDGDIDNVATASNGPAGSVSDDASVDIEVPMICTDIEDDFVVPNRSDATIRMSGDSQNGTNGDDVIFGNKHANTISTNGGENVVRGLGGDDVINGGNKSDVLFGDGGADIINGNSGSDMISGGGGKDRIYGAGGRDKILAGGGDDLVEAGGGKDIINAGAGNDTVQGEGGNDCIAGGTDRGRIHEKSNGDFTVRLGDELFGNGGADKFEYESGDGVDFLFDFKAEDGDRLLFIGVDEDSVDIITADTPYGPTAGIAIDTDGDGAYDGGVFFQQYREPADLLALMQTDVIDFIV